MEGNRIRLASDFYITRDGTPAASIVVRTGAPDKVMEAARELQELHLPVGFPLQKNS